MWLRGTFMFVLPARSSPTNACQSCAIKRHRTTRKERRITRWEHEHVLEEVQKRLDRNPQAMR
jgi:hypothetical protein